MKKQITCSNNNIHLFYCLTFIVKRLFRSIWVNIEYLLFY